MEKKNDKPKKKQPKSQKESKQNELTIIGPLDKQLELLKDNWIPITQMENSLKHLTKGIEIDTSSWTNLLGNMNNELTQPFIELQKDINILQEEILKTPEREQLENYQEKITELEKYKRLRHLYNSVNSKAREKLSKSQSFVGKFESDKPLESVVVSIDIRRSTELMLKAKTPNHFAQFITDLCKKLTDIIIENYGVIDKFTGDGILAFFPNFYSGKDSYYYALKSANDCHYFFQKHYEESRTCFTTILKDIGLGIGIDSGLVNLAKINNELTVVGTPVVYACRLSGTDPGITLVNQSAMETISNLYSKHIRIEDSEIPIKHEGRVLGYLIDLNFKAIEPEIPDWKKFPDDKTEDKKK